MCVANSKTGEAASKGTFPISIYSKLQSVVDTHVTVGASESQIWVREAEGKVWQLLID